MNLKLLVLLIVLPILASEAHFNISAVYVKVQSGIVGIGRSFKSAKESFNNLRKEGSIFGTLKQKAKDNALQILQDICKNFESRLFII